MSGGGGSWLTSSQNPSKPAGETTPSTVLGPVLTFVNLCGISRGAKTNDPARREPSDPHTGFRIHPRARTRLHLRCGAYAVACPRPAVKDVNLCSENSPLGEDHRNF